MKRILIFAALGALFAGCSNDDFSSQTNGQLTPLGVSASINQDGTSTRAIISGVTSFPSNSNIGVILTGTNYNSTHLEYTTGDGTTWTCAANSVLTDQTATVYGYFPYSNDANNLSNIKDNAALVTIQTSGTLTLNSKTSQPYYEYGEQSDYMYATGTDDSTQPTASNRVGNTDVSFHFHHALSELIFTIKQGTYNSTGAITSFGLSNISGGSGTMSLKDGTLTFTSGTNSTSNFTLSNMSLSSNNYPICCLVNPGDLTSKGIILNLTIDGKPMTLTLPTSISSWSAGKSYNYSINVDATGLKVSSVTINDWTNGGNASGSIN